MRIKRITVANYKNIAPTTLDCSKMTALVSPNNYGKSNLFEAIQFGIDFITDAEKTRHAKMCWRRAIPLTPALAGKDYSFCIEFDEPSLGLYRYVKYGFRFSWFNDQGTGGRIVDETIEFRPSESVKYTAFLKRSEEKYRSSKSTSAFRRLRLTNNTLAIDAIALMQDVEIADAVNKIKEIKCRVCDSLALHDSFSPSLIEFELGENVVLGNEDIHRMLALLRERRVDLYNLFMES